MAPSVSDVACGVAIGTAAVVATPYALGAVGFGAAGITAGSFAAKAMSVVWTAGSGIGVIGTLQGIGAAGLTLAQSAVVGTVAGVAAVAAKKK